MNRYLRLIFTFGVVLIGMLNSYSQIIGCTDPLATNFNPEAMINNGSCTYANSSVSATTTTTLPEILDESSGLIFWNSRIWTHNDDSDINVYSINPNNPSDYVAYGLTGTINRDWEEISHDSSYIYIGDFGNNVNGNRTDLKILRIDKLSLLTNNPIIDTISFYYSDQTDFTPTGANNTDFDCEAFIVAPDSIYLFTKQWVSQKTSIYSLPKTPGDYMANYISTHDVEGLITGSVYLRSKRLLAFCGYSTLLQPFIYLLYDFSENDFFGGNKRKISFAHPLHQVEGITTVDGLNYYISNEKFVQSFITIPQRLHYVKMETYLATYINSIPEDNISPEILSEHQDYVLVADMDCYAILPDFRGDVIAEDNITDAEDILIIQTPAPGVLITGNNNTVVLTVYDEADNYSFVSFNVNVEDNIDPVIFAEAFFFQIEAIENCAAPMPDFINYLNVSDNCTSYDNLTFIQSPEPGSEIEGDNNTVAIVVIDEAGNSAEISLTIEITDNTNPIITCPNIPEIILDLTESEYTVQGSEFDPIEVFDNCNILTIENNFNSQESLIGTEFQHGTTNVIWTAFDDSGNYSSCSFDVVINYLNINKEEILGINIFPNPADKSILIRSDLFSFKIIIIKDLTGKEVLRKEVKHKNVAEIDISVLNYGTYIVEVIGENNSVSSKIVKK